VNTQLEASNEIEQLENETISLESETHSLTNEQKELMTVLRAAYEKTHTELRKKNDALRKENVRLQAKIDEIQAKLENPSEPATVVGTAINENCEQIEVAKENEQSSTIESDTTEKMSDEEKTKRFRLF
jgi:peptidoglycan hydrolase CwlO-like protein